MGGHGPPIKTFWGRGPLIRLEPSKNLHDYYWFGEHAKRERRSRAALPIGMYSKVPKCQKYYSISSTHVLRSYCTVVLML